ncbi:MAG: energy-coupling factor transporter transmembrane component T family protein [Thermodesulfobacteriota bacterium]
MSRQIFGQYIPRRSVIHTLDPRIKIGGAVVLSLIVLQGGFFTCAMISLSLLILVSASWIPFPRLLSALRPARIFLALLFVLHLLFTEGAPIPPFEGLPVTATMEGLLKGLLVSWQFAVLLCTGALLTMTTSPGELVSGLERILRPLRIIGIRSHDIALMVSLALRFVPTLIEEMDRIREAQAARGASFRGGLAHRSRCAASMLMPVALGAFRRGDELAAAIEARGYCGGPRAGLRELRLTGRDYTAAALALLVLGVIAGGDLFLFGP